MKFLFALLATTLLAHADTPPHVDVSLYCFQFAPDTKQLAIRTGETTYQDVELSTANITGPVQALVTDGRITLHRQLTAPDGKVTWPVIGSAKVTAPMSRALLLLLPGSSGSPEPYRCTLMDHAEASFPFGTYRIVNLSPFAVRGAIGRSLIDLKSATTGDLKLEGEPGAVVPSRFEFFDCNRWNLLTETRCAIRKDRRWLLCIYRDEDSGRMNLRSIPDRVQQVMASADASSASN
ncbi:hypothetical protein [Luteolibacter sp. LG18]|uniref:hypothetical protein n=1 Tax=Luteolibacter sp. LG18 TaxID=2819286 RepID=UPI002B2CF714|nr:hypothetical protein llg_32470 [Luteolibacter sp. LG18]